MMSAKSSDLSQSVIARSGLVSDTSDCGFEKVPGGYGRTNLVGLRQRFGTTLKASARQVVQQVRTLLRAIRHPGVPWHAKAVCGCAMLYVASPIQLIPSFIPVIGQLDDLLVISLSIKLLKRSTPPDVLEDCMNRSHKSVVSATAVDLPIGVVAELEP
jgi:uncharacterized membrane protein YkvA (DUF1232 family)